MRLRTPAGTPAFARRTGETRRVSTIRSSGRSPSSSGGLLLALVATLLVWLASPVPGSAQNVQERDGWISADLLLGDWVRVGGNNPRNNGMRIRVVGDSEGVRAILTAMPPTGSTALRVGELIWTDFDGWGTLSVRGSDGAYYSASFTITEGAETVRDIASRLEIDIDHNGRGNDQTWERAGTSIDGDWVLVDSNDPDLGTDFRGLQVRVEGDRATLSYVTAVASSRYRTGEEFWQGIDGEPPENRYDSGSGTLEYRDSATRSWREDQFELARSGLLWVGTGDEYQVWARPEEAEERMAAAERGEPLMELPIEPADDPDAAGGDLERSGEERTVDVPDELPPPPPEPEEEAACLATSLRHDAMDVDWGWGITAPRPSTIHMVSDLTDWSAAEREEYEIGVSLPRHEGVAQQSGMYVDMDRSIVPGLEDHDSFIWRENEGGREWQHQANLTADVLRTSIADFRDDGFRFRPIDIEGYTKSSDVRFTAIWLRNHEGVEWQAEFDLTSSQYGSLYQQYREDGYRLTDVEIYSTPQGLRYAGIWVKSCDDSNWRQNRNLTREQFEARDRELGVRLFRLIDFESYMSSQGQLYAAIWEKVPNRRWVAESDLELKSYLSRHRSLSDAGFRLIDYEAYDTPNGPRYAGVWSENHSRNRYEARNTINDSIESYRLQNDVPGVSVVIIQNGDVIYRRGFGSADREAGKEAHAETVYLTASISKAIGATMAASLEERGVGNLDLTANTSDYLGESAADYMDIVAMAQTCSITSRYWFCKSLPDFHGHSLEQLMAKIGCTRHYPEGMPIDNTRHYTWRGEALAQFWDRPLLANCVTGSHYRYSTHGFTFLGAALEAATGEPIADLVDDFARRNELPSMRAMYSGDGALGLPANYDRAQAYTLSGGRPPPAPDDRWASPNVTSNPNVVATRENTSWKVLGGGIEMHALDLARFGWRLLNGEIVSEATRDELWSPLITSGANSGWNSVAPNSVAGGSLPSDVTGIGRAWELGGTAGSTAGRWVRHGGDGTGAGTMLKIWRDQGIVIALLSNRRFYNKNRNPLLDQLATIVLGATPP